jgi:hypothetical protein
VKRTRGSLGALLGLCTAVLAIVTLVWHDWIETVFGVDPDAGSGAVEVLIVVTGFAASLLFFRLAWRGHRQSPAGRS